MPKYCRTQVRDDACPTHLPQPVASGKQPSDFSGATNAMLPAGGFLDCSTAGPSPRDPTSVSVASGQGRAVQLWRDKQDSQRGDGHPHPSSFSPVVGRKPSGCPALQWGKQARCPHRQGVRGGQVLRQARNEGRGGYLRARGPL